MKAGADTSFSAKEAADAITELAKAGVSTDILNGGLNGALSLAAAGSMDVAGAAELAATAMTQFKLKGDQLPHVADLLAAGAGKAQGSVEDLGMALKQGGLVAASTGLSIEETTGGLAAFASAGLIGSDAGTSFKTMLQALTPNSAAAATEMNKLGINAYDSQGKFIGLSKFAGNLKDSMRGLSDEQRNASMKIIFGSDAVRAANVLYEQGAAGITEWTNKVNDAGFAASTAAIKQDNLAGDLEKLGGSMDSVFLKSGSGVNEVFRGLVKNAEGLVDAIGKVDPKFLQLGLGLTAVAGGAALVVGGFLTLTPKILDGISAFKELDTRTDGSSRGLGKVAKAAGVAAAGMAALQIAGTLFTEKQTKSAEDYGQAILKVGKASKSVESQGLDDLFDSWDSFAGEAPDIKDLAGAVKEVVNPHIPAGIQDTLDGMFAWTGSAKNDLGQVRDRMSGLGDQMGALAKNGGADTAAKSFQRLSAEFEKNGKTAQDALDMVPGYRDALKGLGQEAGVVVEGQDLVNFALGKVPTSMTSAAAATEVYAAASSNAQKINEETAEALEKIGVNAEGTVVVLNSFVEVMQRAGLLTLSERDASRGYADALAKVGLNADGTGAAVGEMGREFDNSTEQGRKNQAMFDSVAKAGLSTTKAMSETTDAFGKNVYGQEQLQANLDTTFKNLVTSAGQFGITGGAADELARKVMGIPPGVSVESWMSDYAKKMAEQTTGAINGIPAQKDVRINILRSIETQIRGGGAVGDGASGQDPSMTAFAPGTFAGGYTGGAVASIMGMYGGGVIPGSPPSRPNVDNILAMVNGRPLKVRSGEFLTNEAQTKANLPWLKASNAGLNLGDAMQASYTAGFESGNIQSPAQANGPVYNTTINAQTNASAAHIADELGWALRTQ